MAEPIGTKTEWTETRTVMRVLLVVLAVAAALWMLHALRGVVLLVILATFFAYLVAPLVRLVQRPFTVRGRERNPPRAFAIGIVYALIFGSIGLALFLLLPRIGDQITDFAQEVPAYVVTARGRAQKLNLIYQRYRLPPSVRDTINDTVTRGVASSANYVTAEITNAVGWIVYLPWLALIPILAFFLLKDADAFRDAALKLLPKGRLRWRGHEFFDDVNSTLAAYVRTQLIACLVVGCACAMGFYVIGVPYALALGVIAGLLELIPVVGPLLAGAIAGTVASFHSLSQALWVLIFLLVLRLVQDYVIYPRLIGHRIRLHPLGIILAVLCGAEIAGIPGIFLAIPVVAIVSVGYRHWLEYRGSTGLVADFLRPEQPADPPPPISDTGSASSAPLTADRAGTHRSR